MTHRRPAPRTQLLFLIFFALLSPAECIWRSLGFSTSALPCVPIGRHENSRFQWKFCPAAPQKVTTNANFTVERRIWSPGVIARPFAYDDDWKWFRQIHPRSNPGRRCDIALVSTDDTDASLSSHWWWYEEIVRIENAYVDWGQCHGDVPGIVFTREATFYSGPYSGEKCCCQPPIIQADQSLNVIELESAISALGSSYVCANGHFITQTLPRILLLLKTAPESSKILMPSGGLCNMVMALLIEQGLVKKERVVWYQQSHGTVYFAKTLYVWGGALETPAGLQLVRETLLRTHDQMIEPALNIVVVKRGSGGSRALSNHNELVAALKARFGDHFGIVEFSPQGNLQSDIKVFRTARVMIAPHGAGLFNMLWLPPQTPVVEIAYKSVDVMKWPCMFGDIANKLGMQYWLIAAPGSYNSPLMPSIDRVVNVVSQALNT